MNTLNQKSLIYLTLAAIPLYLVKFYIFSFPTNCLEILILLNILIWLYYKIVGHAKKACLPIPWQILFSISLVFFGTFISFLVNGSTLSGAGILKGWIILPLLFSYVLYSTLENKRELKISLLAIYSSTSIVALIGIVYKLFNITTYDVRLSAFYLSPNYLAMYLAPGIMIGFCFFSSFLKSRFSFFLKSLLAFSFVLILLAFFYTYSYATWIAVFLSLTISFFFYLPKKTFFGFLTILITLFFFLFISQLHSQKFIALSSLSQRSSLASRTTIWKVSAKMLTKNPILGIGPGNFQTNYLLLQPYFPPYLEWAVPQPHNIFLAFWLQSGIFGLIGFIFLLFFIFYSLLKKNQLAETKFRLILFSFFLYTVFHGLVDTPFWKNDLSFLFCSYVGFFLLLLKTSWKIKK